MGLPLLPTSDACRQVRASGPAGSACSRRPAGWRQQWSSTTLTARCCCVPLAAASPKLPCPFYTSTLFAPALAFPPGAGAGEHRGAPDGRAVLGHSERGAAAARLPLHADGCLRNSQCRAGVTRKGNTHGGFPAHPPPLTALARRTLLAFDPPRNAAACSLCASMPLAPQQQHSGLPHSGTARSAPFNTTVQLCL